MFKKKSKNVNLSKPKKEKEIKIIRNTAQKTIPFIEIYDNGMMLVDKEKGKEKYTMVFSMSNINYQWLKDEDKKKKLELYQNVFNSLSPEISYQEIYINVPLDIQTIYDIVTPRDFDRSTEYRDCYYKNQLQFIKEIENNISDTDMFFALSYVKKSKLDNPYNIILQSFSKINELFSEMDVKTSILSPQQIFKLFYAIYNPFDDSFILPADMYSKGNKIRDYIAPASFYFKPKYTALGTDYNAVYFVSGYSSSLDDNFINSILDNKFKIVVSKHVKHVDKDIALNTVTNRMKSLEADRQTRNKRNKQEGTSYIPYDLEVEINSCKDILKTLQEKEELFDVGLYISISAQSQEDLEDIGKIIKGVCSEHLVSIKNAIWRQEDALASIVPVANDKLQISHFLMSSGTAITLPFTYKKLLQHKGFYYGKNSQTKSPLIINRKTHKNGNGFYLGKSGSGKSMYAKMEINDVHLMTEDKIIVIDPEREFVKQAHKLNGTVVKISASTDNFINPFDLPNDKNQEDCIRNKSDLILSLFEVFKNEKLTAIERTIIDRCVQRVYLPYKQSDYDENTLPTFVEFKELLDNQEEKESKDLSLYLEMYVTGSVNIFSKKTNVDFSNRLVVFDLRDLGANLKKAGMLIVLDHIWNEILRNFERDTYTWLYVDEFHMFYSDNEDSNSSGRFFERVFARCRKYLGLATGLTQNITSVQVSNEALSMIQNSQFIVLLEQAKTNLNIISDLYDLSDKQKAKLISPKIGEGLLVSDNLPISFDRLYPSDNIIFETINTSKKQSEG